jgi:ketosteroid isomerase-like protein
MSQDNVEVVRRIFEDFRAGRSEFDSDGTLTRMAGEELWDPEIEWDASESPLPDIRGVYRGIEEVRGFWREWLAAWETVLFEYELVDAGDRVVALVDQQMRGRSTAHGGPVREYAQVCTVRNGLLVHWKGYASQSKALEAAGLSE